jgi:hypothetical protein
MLYPELFKAFEEVRWNLETDVPWDDFEADRLSDEQAQTIKMNAITEWSALPATEMFLRDNRHDSDFCAFMSIWFYEEQKHALVLIEYLRRFRPDLVPTEDELQAVRFDFDPAPPFDTLMMHFCGEVRLNHWYRCAAQWHTEPVIRRIYDLISRDEARHGGAYLRFMKRALVTGRHRGDARVREDRRADGDPASRRQGAASDQPARQSRALPERHRAEPLARPALARALARCSDPLRCNVGKARRRDDPEEPVVAVRPDVRDRPATESVSQGAAGGVMRVVGGGAPQRRIPIGGRRG